MRSPSELEALIRQEKRAMLLVNTHSRRGEELFSQSKTLLEERGFKFLGTYPIQNPKLLDMTMNEIMREKPSLVILGSGDGTVSSVVGHLAYTDTVLGFLPLGTTNNFARSLELPLGLEDAVETINSGSVVEVDLGVINGSYFANIASIGISVEVAASVPAKLKQYAGRFAYALSGIPAFIGHEPFRSTIVTENTTFNIETHQLIIANGSYHSGTEIASDASIDNARLAVFPIGDGGRLQLVRSFAHFILGRKGSQKEEQFITAREVTILTDPPRDVEIDGEVKTTTPVRAAVAPKALKVLVPTIHHG